ncbi:MAG: hypothetical protein ABIG71_01270, partial [Candidatus Uhrbacteria bacterium]
DEEVLDEDEEVADEEVTDEEQPIDEDVTNEEQPVSVEEEAITCTLSKIERAWLQRSFLYTQNRLPYNDRDEQYLCAMTVDPKKPFDVSDRFSEYRNEIAETFAIRDFVNFFRRPPGKDALNRDLPSSQANRDWLVVEFLAYRLRLAPTLRNVTHERACLRFFGSRQITMYKGGVQIVKPAGVGARDDEDFRFIRACEYGEASFAEG